MTAAAPGTLKAVATLVDLNLYVSIVDFLDGRDAQGEFGAGEAAFEWAKSLGLDRDDLNYVLMGLARLAGHPKGENWEELARRDDLDRLVWMFHRAWTDRYGWEATNRSGVARYRGESA